MSGPPHSTCGNILNLVAAIAVLLASLGSIPELTTQTLGPIQKAAPKQLLRCGFDFFL